MKIADLLREALHSLRFLAVPAVFLAVGLPVVGLVPDLSRGPVQGETSLAHHLRTCPQCSADEGEPIIGSYLGSAVPDRDIPQFVELWRSGRLPVESLVSSRITLDDINSAMDNLADGVAVRQLITFD